MRYEFEDYGEVIEMKLHENGLSCSFEILDSYQGEVLYEGFVKWDGCVNWSSDTMVHFCSPTCIDRLKEVFMKVWEMGREMMGKNCDEGYGT